VVQILAKDRWHRQAVPPEVPREGKERGVLFAHAVENPDGGLASRDSRMIFRPDPPSSP